jgi:Fe-S cluster biogenesis protein NfuA
MPSAKRFIGCDKGLSVDDPRRRPPATTQVVKPLREDAMQEKVKEVLDKIRPSLQADGGDVELVEVVDGIVKVRLKGACAGCPMSQMTLKNGIEKLLKREIPDVIAVEGV